ncbi:RusA family crossover junction endodeoxyribonuclease [Nocardioides dongkuii]|uniref:RusA family crossover junction endodeoxyribonuclease n=1 Tax=Nocardioides dongkuii TaxID=2760089 RepID=UPI0015FB45BE|nr:RusA family crossover junction endodeoxyribonuclease [Nocardioides dongkuii]
MAGRPTGYSAGANEQVWKQATRAVFEGCVLPEGCRVQVEIDFLLAQDQFGRVEPDLDNLIKSTVDALEGVLGVRPGTGSRTETDDVRVDRIVASKRPARSGEHPGARIVVSELPEIPL